MTLHDPTIAAALRELADRLDPPSTPEPVKVRVPTLVDSAGNYWYEQANGTLQTRSPGLLHETGITLSIVVRTWAQVRWLPEDEWPEVTVPSGEPIPVFPLLCGQIVQGADPRLEAWAKKGEGVYRYRRSGFDWSVWSPAGMCAHLPDAEYQVGFDPLAGFRAADDNCCSDTTDSRNPA